MRFAVLSFLLALLVAYVAAVAPLKAVVISYPSDTPWSVLDEAKDAIRAAGGQITHEYNIIKGFACKAPATVLEKVSSLSTQFNAMIEEDGVVKTNNDLS